MTAYTITALLGPQADLIAFAVYCVFVVIMLALYVWWALYKWEEDDGDDHEHTR